MLDRANPLYGSDYNFREIYLLMTAAEDEESVPIRAENGLKGWIECFSQLCTYVRLFLQGELMRLEQSMVIKV